MSYDTIFFIFLNILPTAGFHQGRDIVVFSCGGAASLLSPVDFICLLGIHLRPQVSAVELGQKIIHPPQELVNSARSSMRMVISTR